MISERSYERPWWRGGKVRLNYNGGGSWEHGKFQQLPKTLPSNAFLRGARGGWKGEASAADRETRKKAKFGFQMMEHFMSKSCPSQVDYNEEKSSLKL